MFRNRSRISPLKLASLGAIAATALAAAPTALAATSGGAPVTPAAHAANQRAVHHRAQLDHREAGREADDLRSGVRQGRA